MSHCVTKGHKVFGMSAQSHGDGLQGVFVSSARHSLDPKKRLTIPSEWRDQVVNPASLYVLPDIHHKCLCVFPAAEMMHRIQSLRQHGVTDKKARFFARVLGSQSELVTWDSQGRIRIKDDLLGFAQLVDQVLLVGVFDHFELWNPDVFREESAMDGDSLRDAAQYVGF